MTAGRRFHPCGLAMWWLALCIPALAATGLGTVLAGTVAAATPANCPALFQGGQPPAIAKPALVRRTTALCFTDYAVLFSGLTRTPLWSAEHPTRASIAAARQERRIGQFHAEQRLPYAERSDLFDYRRSGFDRGHMTPSGDMPDDAAQQQTFSLANIVPQNPSNNSGLWSHIESAVRALAQRDGELYVVTGPIFEGSELQTAGRVAVPTALYKAVYDPRRGSGAAYIVANAATHHYDTVSLAALGQRIGINVFPALPARVQGQMLALPAPESRRQSPSRRRSSRRRYYGW